MLNEPVAAVACQQEDRMLETLPLILRLAGARKHNLPDWATIEDLRQTVALNLLKWKRLRPELELSGEEWLKIANTATINQVGKYHHAARVRRETPLAEIEKYEPVKRESRRGHRVSPAGNTPVEVDSLAGRLWKVIKTLTFRERCAILLEARGLLGTIVGRRGCDITQIAEALEMECGELFAVIELVPLAAGEIARLLADKLKEPVTAKQVIEARSRAKAKIRRALDDKTGCLSAKNSVDDEPRKTRYHSKCRK